MTKGKEEANKKNKLNRKRTGTGNLNKILEQPEHQRTLGLKDSDGNQIIFDEQAKLQIEKNIKLNKNCKYKNMHGRSVPLP